MSILNTAFAWFLESTAAASVVILIVMVLRRIFRRRLTPRLLHVLWVIVLIRLILPVFPDSPVSLFNLAGAAQPLNPVGPPAPMWEGHAPQVQFRSAEPHHFPEGSRSSGEVVASGGDPSVILEDGRKLFVSTGKPLPFQPWVVDLVSAVWFTGAALLLLGMLVRQVRIHRIRRSLNEVTDPRLVSMLEDARRRFGVSVPIRMYHDNTVSSPYIAGLHRPWIGLPEHALLLPEKELYHMLSHETAHVRRRDLLWNLGGSLAAAVHWMNPIVWAGLRRMKADRELACDACVLDMLGEGEAHAYGMTMIGLWRRASAQRSGLELMHFGSARRRKEAERRIGLIAAYRRGSYKLSTAGGLCAVLFAMTVLTNAVNPAAAVTAAEPLLFDEKPDDFNSLKRAVDYAPFRFKVPGYIPGEYGLDRIILNSESDNPTSPSDVNITFSRYDTERIAVAQGFSLTATLDSGGLESAYERFYKDRLFGMIGPSRSQEVRREKIDLGGMPGYKVYMDYGQWEAIYYLWSDEGVQYMLQGLRGYSIEERLAIVDSMRYPDQELMEDPRYTNPNLFMEPIYTAEDLKQVPSSIGFTPKFQLDPAGLKTVRIYETQKVNFGHPVNERDRSTRTLGFRYRMGAEDTGREETVYWYQIKDQGIYEGIKQTGSFAYSRIDGVPFTVLTEPVVIGGRPAYRTVPYKEEGPLSTPSETDHVSYFWGENGILFQATMKARVTRQEEIVEAFMNAPYLELRTGGLEESLLDG